MLPVHQQHFEQQDPNHLPSSQRTQDEAGESLKTGLCGVSGMCESVGQEETLWVGGWMCSYYQGHSDIRVHTCFCLCVYVLFKQCVCVRATTTKEQTLYWGFKQDEPGSSCRRRPRGAVSPASGGTTLRYMWFYSWCCFHFIFIIESIN